MVEKVKKTFTLIINRSPYGDEYAFNAIRLATQPKTEE